MVDVILTSTTSEDVILQESVINTFWRTGYWDQLRTAEVQYVALTDEYEVVFNYW